MAYMLENVLFLKNPIRKSELLDYVVRAYSDFYDVRRDNHGSIAVFPLSRNPSKDFLSWIEISIVPPENVGGYFRKVAEVYSSGNSSVLSHSLLGAKSVVTSSATFHIPESFIDTDTDLAEILSEPYATSVNLVEALEFMPDETKSSYYQYFKSLHNFLSLLQLRKGLYLSSELSFVRDDESFADSLERSLTQYDETSFAGILSGESGESLTPKEHASTLLEQMVLSRMNLPDDLEKDIIYLCQDMEPPERKLFVKTLVELGSYVSQQSEENYPLMDSLFKLAMRIDGSTAESMISNILNLKY